MPDIRISAYTLSCAAATGLTRLREAITQRRSGLTPNDFPHCALDTWIGRVTGADNVFWPHDQQPWQCRNNALAALALAQDDFTPKLQEVIARYGAHRVGIAVGTSTSSIGRTEQAYREPDPDNAAVFSAPFRQPALHNPHAPGLFLAARTGIAGPVMTISTACSSSAKVFAAGARWLNAGLVDAVLVGGVDSLCLSVLHGFHSLQLVSTRPCRPFDRTRDGINIGEGAGFAILQHATATAPDSVRLTGYGESSDAYHMSHPHPQGAGAVSAMRDALRRARLDAGAIGYINLHGTASQANDLIEAKALQAVFSGDTQASSTKGWTGHTLGAAGIIEALIAVEALHSGLLPGTLQLEQTDPDLEFPILADNRQAEVQHVMSNSFGFGGNNCSLIFSRMPA